MARSKEFDPDAAVSAAMELFWLKGYEATSIQDLVEHLGIGRQSLYATFGSKHGLYLQALDRYRESQAAGLVDALSTADPVMPAVRRLLESLAHRGRRARRGCFMVNSAMELLPQDKAVQRRAAATFSQIEEALVEAIRRAQDHGELPTDQSPTAAAHFLLTVIQGIRVVDKADASAARVGDAVDMSLRALGHMPTVRT